MNQPCKTCGTDCETCKTVALLKQTTKNQEEIIRLLLKRRYKFKIEDTGKKIHPN